MHAVLRPLAATLAAVFAAQLSFAAPAVAQSNYPNRPIRMLVGFPPGGATDIIARLVAAGLQARLGQPVVVENKPGSGANIAAELAARAEPDGYTIMHGPDNVFIFNPHLYPKLNYDPLKDFVPITSLVANQIMLAVHPSVPAQTLKEFVELNRKANPPRFYASIGNGSPHHLAMEMLKQHTGMNMVHVPYRGGGPATIALLAGEIDASFGGGSLVPTIQSGKVRGLATTALKRSPALPDLPTIDEVFPGYELLIWHGLFAPAGTPPAIVEKLRAETIEVLKSPEVREKLASSGSGEPYLTSPEEFNARIRGDYEKYGKVIRAIGMKME